MNIYYSQILDIIMQVFGNKKPNVHITKDNFVKVAVVNEGRINRNKTRVLGNTSNFLMQYFPSFPFSLRNGDVSI